MISINDIRSKFIYKYLNKQFTTLEDGSKTIDIYGAYFSANEPSIFLEPNEDYIKREIEWYNSQSLNVNDIPGTTPVIWKRISDKDGNINSNYGYLIYSDENYNQYEKCLSSLLENPASRRACMIYNRPSMHEDYSKNGMNDFVCTFNTQTFIQNKTLLYIVNMRSNDAIFGYRNDYAWHKYVAENFMKDYNERALLKNPSLKEPPIKFIKIMWFAGTLHIYERHFNHIQSHIDERREYYGNFEEVNGEIIPTFITLEH